MIVAKIRVDFACANTVWANPITAGMVGAEVQIEYAGPEWDGLTKTVVFSGAVVKDWTTDDSIVEIPAECLARAGVALKVGVFGFRADDKKIVIPTVETSIGRVLRGTDPSGDESTNPTLPVWAEILETAKRAESVSGTSAQEALNAAERALSAEDAASASAGYAAQSAKSAENAAASASGAAASAGQAMKSAAQSADAAKTSVDGLQKDLSKVKDDIADEAKRAKEAENNRIKKFYTGNLGAVSVADSDDGAVRNLVIEGKCAQITTIGKNLFNPSKCFGPLLPYTNNGVTWQLTDDGAIVGIGEPSIDSGVLVTLGLEIPISEYGFSVGDKIYARQYIDNPNSAAMNAVLCVTGIDGKRYGDTTICEGDSTVRVYHQIDVSKYAPGLRFYYALYNNPNSDAVFYRWEPYTGGAPSPSPDYPQDIKCVEGCTMTLANADGTETQTAAIPFPLRGIGDVRDELYVYADGTGKLVQRIKHMIITADDYIYVSGMSTENFKNFGVGSIKDAASQNTNLFSNAISNRFSRGKRQGFNVKNTVFYGGSNSDVIYFCLPTEVAQSVDDFREFVANNTVEILYEINPIEVALTAEQVKAMFELRTYYGGTNITYESENGVEPVVNFDYACALENFVEYIKAAQGDDRKFIYDMDERMTDAEYVSALAYVNSEYATALTELEV